MSEEKKILRASIFVISASLVINPITVGYVFSPDGKLHSPSWIAALLFFELVVLCAGVLLFIKRKTFDREKLFFSAVTIGIVPLVIELGLHILQSIMFTYDAGNIQHRASLSMYKQETWAVPLLKEEKLLQTEYDQYTGWRTKEFHGTYINVDSNGMRRTCNPASSLSEKTEAIYVFGGSAIWGSFVRDSGTIPSYISMLLNRRSHLFDVYNYGERGYTFTQNVVRLVLLLRAGNVPRHVIFYEGANDVMSAYYTGHGEVNGLDFELSKAFSWKKQPALKQIGLIMKDFLEKHFMIYLGIRKLTILLYGEEFPGWAAKNYGPKELEQLAQDVCNSYAVSFDFLQKLSLTYGFTLTCILQPVLFSKAHPSVEEQNADVISRDHKLKKLYLDTYNDLKKASLPHFYDMSTLFDTLEKSVFSDYAHLSEEGNHHIAEKISEIFSQQQQ